MTYSPMMFGGSLHRTITSFATAWLALALLPILMPVPAAASSSGELTRIVVGLTTSTTPPAARAVISSAGLVKVGSVAPLRTSVYAGPPASAAQAAELLAAVPGVAYAEIDRPARALQRTPTDPLWAQQWGAQLIRAPLAWERTIGDQRTIVAVLDTGVDRDHLDLQGALTGGMNFVEPGQAPADRHGHGTMSTGVIAARAGNGLGIAGLCWECRVMPVKVLGDDGTGAMSNVAAGIVWATDNGASVINMSLGGPSPSQVVSDAVAYARQRDVVLVAAAGNEGVSTPFYPAAHEGVLSVAGSTQSDQRYDWSNFGGTVNVAAPGCNPATSLTNLYSWYCGTSSAAPVVAGLAGLIRSLVPTATEGTVRAVITSSAVPLGFVAHGRVDAAAAVALAAQPPSPPPAEPGPVLEPVPSTPLPDGGGGSTPVPEPTTEPVPGPELPAPEPAPEEEPEPEAGTTIRRDSGNDRFATAAVISRRAFEPGVARVYVATGATFPDALAAGAAAARSDGPVLISERDRLPAAIAEELERLDPDDVVVAGGERAVGPATMDAITAAAGVPARRISGADRYATAAAVALDAFDARPPVAYVATGEGFADALAGVPAAAWEGAPMLLTARNALPQATAAALEQLRPRRIVVLGGRAAVSDEVQAALRSFTSEVVRRAGADRFATAAAVAAVFPAPLQQVYLATGGAFPDALAGGPAAARAEGPLLLASPDEIPSPTRAELRRLRPNLLVVLGGQAAISQDTANSAAEVSAASQPE